MYTPTNAIGIEFDLEIEEFAASSVLAIQWLDADGTTRQANLNLAEIQAGNATIPIQWPDIGGRVGRLRFAVAPSSDSAEVFIDNIHWLMSASPLNLSDSNEVSNTILSPAVSHTAASITLDAVAITTPTSQALMVNATGPLENGSFDQPDTNDDGFGWDLVGTVTIGQGHATLTESGRFFSGLRQGLLLDETTRSLRIVVSSLTLGQSPNNPGDVFEVALLDADQQSLFSPAGGLSNTDALVNIQADAPFTPLQA